MLLMYLWMNLHMKSYELDFFAPSKNTLLYRLKVAHKIKSIQASFDKIFKMAVDLGLQPVAYLGSTVQDGDIRSTPSYEDKSIIVGRDEDVSYLVQTVCKKHEEDLQVLVVAGMGGQGKTTLARMVFNSDHVITRFPDQRMWITVSDDFDFIKILNQMVESLTLTNLGLTNPQALTRKLQESLKGKKFLLILDDVWNEESVKWDNLRNSLLEIGGDKGSCILVTTRKQEVIDAMRSCVSYWLEILTEDESYELFKKIAFSDGGFLETEAFATFGRSMVKRCGGLPLAIKALAGLLYSKKSEQEWLEIQCSETWESKSVLPSLKLSYDNLPSLSLKRCFAYCSIMPKNSFIYKDELIQIWLALGFLLPPRRSIALTEDIGSKYFKILLGNSLLQDEEKDECGNIIRCKMHDLVHDLALEVSKHHSVSVKAGEELSHDCKAVYMRLDNRVSNIKPTILKRAFERVQVLYAGADILLHVLPYLTHLTVLVLNADDNQVAQELPFSLRKMKYLKHLDISRCHSRLPTDITELYNLQTLRVWNLDEFPKRFSNLINLRHLYITYILCKKCKFNGIERLTSLQTLPFFVVSKDQNCLLGQLGGLKNLRGEVTLYGLYEVANIEEARKAKLCEKSRIQSLHLNWRYTEVGKEGKMKDREYNDQDVMEGLEPHPNLKTLTIVGFEGKKFASWITMMLNLVKITLIYCNRCEVLPPLGQLPKLREIRIDGMGNVRVVGDAFWGGQSVFPQLERLKIANCRRLRKILPCCFPSLKQLHFHYLPNLEEWEAAVISSCSQSEFPKLERLEILGCPRLRNIQKSYFPSLKKLKIYDSFSEMLGTMSRDVSSLTSLPLTSMGDGGGDSSSFSIIESLINDSLSLTELDLIHCQGLKCLTLGSSLEYLKIDDCPHLSSINLVEGSAGLTSIGIRKLPPSLLDGIFAQIQSSRLKYLRLGPLSELDYIRWPFSSSSSSSNLIQLRLYGWEEDKSLALFEQLPFNAYPALTDLTLQYFKGVKALPDSIAKLPSLRRLRIEDCYNLESLPAFEESHTLQLLYIVGCPVLRQRCRKGQGPEWFKIQYVPTIIWNRPGCQTSSSLVNGDRLYSIFPALTDLYVVNLKKRKLSRVQ
ncbi:putative disease resistance protein RGA3 [Daucus carota subsp. sativus]|uniref:putative disease resistance protein RGA3 n=1 Tax=Daucus carota subsp. sativus TaxID=79200 RepID=UPI0007F02EC4|nr:PREDICTED: putative disease resistance protein RGA3 [Daucus carota subsp. sativus]